MSDRPTTNPTQAAPRGDAGDLLLKLTDVCTHFRTPRGLVRAVDGVSLELLRGESLGIVGESGSGKTIGDKNRKQMRNIWGREMAMIFQDPMTSLNPLMRIGKQLTEPLEKHLGMSSSDAQATAERLLMDVRIPEAAHEAVPPRDVGGHAPAGDDRHRHVLRPDDDPRRRADHRPRRHRAGADP